MTERTLSAATAFALSAIVSATAWGCGASRDQPGDCEPDEFYNESRQRCIACPVVTPPSCRSGCGFRVARDDQGCPVARCRDNCDRCPEGERYSASTGLCVACPAEPDCSELTCEGSLSVEEGSAGPCPNYKCGECETPRRGCDADEAGRCVDPA